jgi:hypothetical protein
MQNYEKWLIAVTLDSLNNQITHKLLSVYHKILAIGAGPQFPSSLRTYRSAHSLIGGHALC